MNDIDQLIETTNRLCNRLQLMANDERQFGFDLCHRMEQLSWEIEKSANEMRDISAYIIGGVA
jgi:hypothetical protein